MFVVTLLPCREPEFFSCRVADTSRSASAMVVYEEHRIARSSSFFNRWSSIELGCFTPVMLETATLVAGAESLSGKRGCGGKISFSMVKFAKNRRCCGTKRTWNGRQTDPHVLTTVFWNCIFSCDGRFICHTDVSRICSNRQAPKRCSEVLDIVIRHSYSHCKYKRH